MITFVNYLYGNMILYDVWGLMRELLTWIAMPVNWIFLCKLFVSVHNRLICVYDIMNVFFYLFFIYFFCNECDDIYEVSMNAMLLYIVCLENKFL